MTVYDPKLYPLTASCLKRERKNGPFAIKHNLAWKKGKLSKTGLLTLLNLDLNTRQYPPENSSNLV